MNGQRRSAPQDEKIYCDDHGRVTNLTFLDRYSAANDQKFRGWNASPKVGSVWGTTWPVGWRCPRIGSEVIRQLLNGDPESAHRDRRTYHAPPKTTPPYVLPKIKQNRGEVTPTKAKASTKSVLKEPSDPMKKLPTRTKRDQTRRHTQRVNTHQIGHDQQSTIGQ